MTKRPAISTLYPQKACLIAKRALFFAEMLSGPDQFKDWMRRRGFTQADACRYLSFDEPYLSGLLTGRRSPGLANAIHIERLTGISVEAWASELDEAADRQPALSGKRSIVKG